MTELVDPSAIPPAPQTPPISETIDDYEVWPHGPVDPDPAMAEVQRKWLMVELFLVEFVRLNPVEAAQAVEFRKTWPKGGNWLPEVFKDPFTVVVPGLIDVTPALKKERAAWREFMAEAKPEWELFAAEYATTEHEILDYRILREVDAWDERDPDWQSRADGSMRQIKPVWRDPDWWS